MHAREKLSVGLDPLDARQRRRGIDHVGVDGLRAEHERGRLEPSGAGDADVEHRAGPARRQSPRSLQRRLHRSDAATEGVGVVHERELPVGRGDDEHGRVP